VSRRNSRIITTILVISILNSFFIFYQKIPNIIVGVLLAIELIFTLVYLRKYIGYYWSLLITSIIFIPLSFLSLLGSSTDSLPVSWFHVLVLILFVVATINTRASKSVFYYLIFIILFLIYGMINIVFLGTGFDGMKQVLMIVLFLFSFVIGTYASSKCNRDNFMLLKKTFIYSCITLSLQILIQYFSYSIFGLQIGYVSFMGGGRNAFAGLLSDFSFATLYLACGIFISFLDFLHFKSIQFWKFAIISGLLLLSAFFVSSRTGLFALIITLILYLIFYITRNNAVNKRLTTVLFLGTVAMAFVIVKLTQSRGGQSFLDDSGRMSDYLTGIRYWVGSPFLGIGFGLNHLTNNYGLTVPHNFFIQYLCQGGLIGLMLVCLPFAYFSINNCRKDNPYRWVFFLVIIGAMVIPDITSSRFLYFVVVLVACFNAHNYEYTNQTILVGAV